MSIGTYVLGGMAIVIALMATAGTLYFKYSQKKMIAMAVELSTQQLEIEMQAETMALMEENQVEVHDSLTDLFNASNANMANIEVLRGKFNKGGRDIGFLALKKPGLIEKIINKGTKNVGRCMELITGAPMTELEKNEFTENGTFAVCNS